MQATRNKSIAVVGIVLLCIVGFVIIRAVHQASFVTKVNLSILLNPDADYGVAVLDSQSGAYVEKKMSAHHKKELIKLFIQGLDSGFVPHKEAWPTKQEHVKISQKQADGSLMEIIFCYDRFVEIKNGTIFSGRWRGSFGLFDSANDLLKNIHD